MDAIETNRLRLRNFRPGDAADLLDYLQTPRASCFLSMKLNDLPAAQLEAEQRSRTDDYIAVCDRVSDRLIGDVFAMPEEDTFSVGWNFSARAAGQGFALEAAQALFHHLFTTKAARRLYAYAEDDNLASRRLCQKLGMRQEGLFLEYVSFGTDDDGRPLFENTCQYAILRKEWQAQQDTA
jgi:[ribosomal protein S5]-alanine N-acetyltransferase